MSPWHISVLIPARNEEQLLGRCLRSVRNAIAVLPLAVTFDVIVAVDCSTDRTWQIAPEETHCVGTVVHSHAGVVGKARAVAAELALERYRGPLNRCWLANTDADPSFPQAGSTISSHLPGTAPKLSPAPSTSTRSKNTCPL